MSALLKTPLRQVGSVKDLLMNEGARNQLALVAANQMKPERMMRVVANAIRTTPKLGNCEPMSFLGALMQCAALGLEPNTVLGHAYLIPFDNKKKGITEVQVVVGYKGLIDLARRSGHITSISANIHYSDDELWEYEEGTEATLRHRPGAQEGKKLHAYAIAKFKDGGHAYVVLPWRHVLKIRDGSQGWQSAVRFGKQKDHPWHTHEDAMAMKTAVRALSKYLPLSVEFADALSVDEKQADYRGFAIDPAGGVTIEGEADEPEAEQEQQAIEAEKILPEQAQPRQRRQERPAEREAVKYADDPAKDAPQAKAAPVEKEDQPAADEGKPAQASLLPEEAAEVDYSANPKLRQFVADVVSMGSIDDALDLWADDLDQIKGRNPDLHAAMMAAGTKADAERQ